MSFDFKDATPVTSGANSSTLLFGAANSTATDPTTFTVNAIADLVANMAMNVGNTIANLIANSTAIVIANSTFTITVNPTTISWGNSTVNSVANSLVLKIADTTGTANVKPGSVQIQANVLIDSVKISIGNSTANMTTNSITFSVANASGFGNVTPTVVSVGNSTVFCNIGVAGFSLTGSNTFNLGSGSRSATANGYTFLNGGLIMQWGWVLANSSSGSITFPLTFPTTCFNVQATANGDAANAAYVHTFSTSGCSVRTDATTNPASQNLYWFAIGN